MLTQDFGGVDGSNLLRLWFVRHFDHFLSFLFKTLNFYETCAHLSVDKTRMREARLKARKKKIHLYLVIMQMLLSKATYNWGIHKAINLEETTK